MNRCVNCNAELADEAAILCPKCEQSFEGSGDKTLVGDLPPEDPARTLAGDADLPPQGSTLRRTAPPGRTIAPAPQTGATTADPGKTLADIPQQTIEAIRTLWEGSVSESDANSRTIKDDRPAGTSTVSRLVVKQRRLEQEQSSFDPASPDSPDYELLRVLGEGGMGIVYEARQTSIDRSIAIKMIKPHAAKNADVRQKFLAEAAVTGDLDHPNIVPIHDLGATADGALFYAMKRVQGTPWSSVIGKKTLLENIAIFMSVADAMAFAHARGVIHRDLKPENVMLGEYGEVLVMDWGLAASVRSTSKAESIRASSALGGTPAYMAPEMALGQAEQIGKHSDIYLLGAILYEAVTGRPPHAGKSVMECLYHAADNVIVPTDKEGELVETALKAMSLSPADRHATVRDLQADVKRFLDHHESIAQAERSRANLERARSTRSYNDYAQALYGFKESLKLWADNLPARDGLAVTQYAYAETALDNGDLDLAGSLLQGGIAEHRELYARVEQAKAEQEARRRRLRTLTRSVILLVVLVLVAVSAGLALVNRQRQQAELERQRAESEKARAVLAEQQAQSALVETEKARTESVQERNRALEAEAETRQERAKAEEAFVLIAQEQTKALSARAEAEKTKAELERAQSELAKSAPEADTSSWAFAKAEAVKQQEAAAQQYKLPVQKDISLADGVVLTLRLIPPGEFMMGSPVGERKRDNGEVPHKVRITQPFYIAAQELTQGQWKAVTGKNPAKFAETGDDRLPVESIGIADVQKTLLPKLAAFAPEGMAFRLPTEAEWEYACRAGTNTEYSAGSGLTALEESGWFGMNAERKTHPVGQKAPNAWGIYDMHGNVAEFCQDRHDPNFYLRSPENDPVNLVEHYRDDEALRIVIRGGGWLNLPEHTRSAYRSWCFSYRKYDFLGVRVVLAAPAPE